MTAQISRTEVALPPTVQVGPFHVADASSEDVVDSIVAAAFAPLDEAVLVYALHIGGLNERHDAGFVSAMADGDLVYADGGSVVVLARGAGAHSIERAPTTDIGWAVMEQMSQALGRPVRVALVGGPLGLAERAGAVIEERGVGELVYAVDGYRQHWERPLADLRAARPELVIVGMGAPREMLWCSTWRAQLPATVVLTAGGWFGHIAGDEKRAPRLLRRSGLEWIARTAQSPRRLAPRYAKGLWTTAVMWPGQRRYR